MPLHFSDNAAALDFKERLKALCLELIRSRMQEARSAMDRAQEAVGQEEKSSMGDKYETSRAMGQIDSDRAGAQLMELGKQLVLLQPLNVEHRCDHVRLGALVETTQAIYYLAIGLGVQSFAEHKITIISPGAPIAQVMMGKRNGESFLFQGKEIKILSIY